MGQHVRRISLVTLVSLTTVLCSDLAIGQSAAADGSEIDGFNKSSVIEEVPASPRLQRVRTLIQANVLDLASRVMEEQGPPQLPNGEWLNWERQLWTLYASQKNWEALIHRIQGIPPAFPRQIKTEAELQLVAAFIALGDGDKARAVLRSRLLSPGVSERDKRRLRQQVIESYVSDDLLAEANNAATSFQADYRAQDNNWLLLNAAIALASGNDDRAVNLLAPLDAPPARVLRLYARLQNGSLEPSDAVLRGEKMLAADEFAEWRYTILGVMTDAARRASNLSLKVELMERHLLLASQQVDSRLSAIPAFTDKDLQDAYRHYAYDVANRAGYLRGEEDGWSRLAVEIDPNQQVARRAVWATISMAAQVELNRLTATDQFVTALMDADRIELVPILFGQDGILGPLRLNPATGLRLSNLAIERGDMQLAADANATITAPPPGMDYGEWLRQSGRVAIIAGRHQQGADQLQRWIQSRDQFSPEETDSVLQPIFDLQTVDQHRLAINLLELVETRAPGGRYPREIAFWLAESYSATRQHVKAADYFLFSALQKDNGFDQWGESARYRAADALLEGNFFEDARTLFEDLLKRATEETRRQALMQKLQDLRLRQSSLEGEKAASG